MLPARRPYVGELASSAVLRCCRQFNVSLKKLGSVSLGKNGWRPSFLGANPLKELADLFRLSPEDLLWDHTCFPYATAMMQEQYFNNAIANALGETKDRIGLGSVMHNATRSVTWRRYCPVCVAEEYRASLESFWHCAHNLPGVWTCAAHGVFLYETQIPACAASILAYPLPHECDGRRLGIGSPPEALLRVGLLASEWQLRPRGPGVTIGADAYRDKAVANDWLSESSPVSQDRLASAMRAIFPRKFLVSAGFGKRQEHLHWAALMLRPHVPLQYSPLKHALVLTLVSFRRPIEIQPLDHIPTGPSPSSADLVDRFYANAAQAHLQRLLRRGQTVTTEEFLRAVGCWGAYRHRKRELPLLRRIVRLFRGSTATVRRLSEKASLYRWD